MVLPDNVNNVVIVNKSSAVTETGDDGHNRHGPKRGEAAAPPF